MPPPPVSSNTKQKPTLFHMREPCGMHATRVHASLIRATHPCLGVTPTRTRVHTLTSPQYLRHWVITLTATKATRSRPPKASRLKTHSHGAKPSTQDSPRRPRTLQKNHIPHPPPKPSPTPYRDGTSALFVLPSPSLLAFSTCSRLFPHLWSRPFSPSL